MDLYQKEQDAALSFILNERYFKLWEKYEPNERIADLEIFITPECNQKCEYCYLHKRQEELYPSNLLDKNLLKHNLHILLQHFLDKNYYISQVELFSGEIWHTDFGIEILEIILSYLKKGLKFDSVIIPSNGYFANESHTFNRIQKIINQYNQLGKGLLFSLSVDGAIVENESRPLKNGEIKNEEFYDRLFCLAYKNNFFFHPMISASNVKYWIENYKWFYEKLTEYGCPGNLDLMTLEVRNDDWTDENIADYLEFLKFNIYFMYEKGFNKNLEMFAKFASDEYLPPFSHGSYLPYRIFETRTKAGNCSLPHMLTIRLGDFMLPPCHRLSIPEYHFGQLVVENDKIIGVKANNVAIANRLLLANNDICTPKCDTCIIRDICVKGCFGSQYEHSLDPFVPIECVCKLFKAKIRTVFEVFEELGVIKEWEKYDLSYQTYPTIEKLLSIKRALEEEGNV